MSAFDQTRLGEVRQGPTHRDPRDAELVAQRLLGGQRLPRPDGAASDLVVQHQVELPM
jgi:hypothetical protein